MSEEEKKEENQKPRTSKLAVISLVLMIPAAIATYISVTAWGSFSRPDTSGFVLVTDMPIFLVILYLAVILTGLTIACISLFQIRTSEGRLRGKFYAGMSIAIFIFSFVPTPKYKRKSFPHPGILKCRANLHTLKKAFMLYSSENEDKYPTADKWCDLLKDYYVEDSLVCPSRERDGERCSYAINPYCEPNSPPDTVLLFETKGGWNQFGGIEIVSMDNHPYERDRFWGHKIRGCNIVFNDNSVRFVREEEFPKLKWKTDENQGETFRVCCPVCGAWSEGKSGTLILSMFEGSQPGDETFDDIQQARSSMAGFGSFVEKHSTCLESSNFVMMKFFYPNDNEYYNLDPSKKE